MKKCEKCNGHKTTSSMGGIRVKCTDCKGLGFIVEDKLSVVSPIVKSDSKKVKLVSVKMD